MVRSGKDTAGKSFPGLWPYLLFALIVLAAGSARAACSNPTGNETEFRYNTDSHTYQFCNGTTWIAVGVVALPYNRLGDTRIEAGGDGGNDNLVMSQEVTLANAGTIQSLSFYVTAAAGNLVLGVYDATGPAGGPGNLLAQTNGFVPTTGWNTQNVITPVALATGNYWLAYNPDNGSLDFKKQNNTGNCEYEAYTYSGTLPATFSTTPTSCTATTWSFYATLTNSQCATPTGSEGDILYNTNYHTYQFCNGVTWVQMGQSIGGGGGGCSSPAGVERDIIYNSDYDTYQFCNGTTWVHM